MTKYPITNPCHQHFLLTLAKSSNTPPQAGAYISYPSFEQINFNRFLLYKDFVNMSANRSPNFMNGIYICLHRVSYLK
jgi:hypothetical protein